MFSSEAWLANTGANFYNGVAKQSLRFDDGSSAYLTRTPSSASNRRTFTFSAWIKRGVLDANNVGGSNDTPIFSAGSNGQPFDVLRTMSQLTDGANILMLYANPSGATDYSEETNASIRDTSAWYHIVMAVDTTQSTAGNRVKFYINGTLQTAVGQNYAQIPEDHDFHFNNTVAQEIGRNSGNTGRYFDGYMAEVNFVDGTQYDASYFGETKNGVWIAKTPNVTYGTNGYRLQFKNTGTGTASASTIGADTSGNTNHFTSAGIVASDCNMPDSPENNFCTMNSLDKQSQVTLSEGTLKVRTSTTGGGYKVRGTMQLSGKVYFEGLIGAVGGDIGSWFGIADNSDGITDFNSSRRNGLYYNASDFRKAVDGSFSVISSGALSANDIIGLAYNFDDNEFSIYRNNSAVLTNATFTNDVGFSPIADLYRNDSTDTGFIFNFGQDSSFAGAKTAQGNTDGNGIGDFYYAPPSGFLAICSANLPEPTISPNSLTQADDHFNTVLYTGNATDDTAIAVDFQPDWTWIKKRSGAQEHVLFDSSRGATKRLFSNLTNAESDEATSLKAFTSSGFTLGTHSSVNDNTETFVAWNWKANGGTTTTNDASSTGVGSQDSVYQANTTSGFSIVLYTGTGSNDTFAHGLGVAPKWIIHKKRNGAQHWVHYHVGIGNTRSVLFNTDAQNSASAVNFNNTSPTSTVFSLGTDAYANASGDTYVAYCFAEIEGYSKFGSYTGNATSTPADGTFVYTSFKPLWLMVKRTDLTGQWRIYDTKRSPINYMDELLSADASDAEAEGSTSRVDFLSNGFKFRGSASGTNKDGGTYIYMAFGSSFKYANAR